MNLMLILSNNLYSKLFRLTLYSKELFVYFLNKLEETRIVSQAQPSWCRIAPGDTSEATFRFTIEDFINRPEKNKEKLESTCFNVNGQGNLKTKWQLEIYPKGSDEANKEYISLYLHNKGQDKVRAQYKMVFIDCAGNERESCKSSTTLEFATSGAATAWGRHKWLKRDKLNEHPDLIPDGKLTIECTVTVNCLWTSENSFRIRLIIKLQLVSPLSEASC